MTNSASRQQLSNRHTNIYDLLLSFRHSQFFYNRLGIFSSFLFLFLFHLRFTYSYCSIFSFSLFLCKIPFPRTPLLPMSFHLQYSFIIYYKLKLSVFYGQYAVKGRSSSPICDSCVPFDYINITQLETAQIHLPCTVHGSGADTHKHTNTHMYKDYMYTLFLATINDKGENRVP